MASRTLQLAIGTLVGAVGAYLVVNPEVMRSLLGRHPKHPSDWINLRASFGGTLVGLGAFVAWLPAVRPWQRTIIGLLMWTMAGIGLARVIGFVLDGHPDTRQYIWITAEVAIVAVCAGLLGRRRRR